MVTEIQPLKAADFKSDQDVKWCPGCGDYSILAAVQRTLPKLSIPKEDNVFVSGIGCSSRFPYYMNTYGFHTIHGRAPAIATGVKSANPNLTVWLISGDGDALSIGGNHFIHLLRRNVDVNYLLFNNEIYGLTKGQISPTSRQGTVTKTSLSGGEDKPVNPINLAVSAGATFVARTIDRDPKHMASILEKAAAHKGTSFVEIYQNCVIFNDGVFDSYSDKQLKSDTLIHLEHDKPLTFSDETKGIRLDGFKPEVVDLTTGSYSKNDLYVHNENEENQIQTIIYGQMTESGEFPTPVGVFRSVTESTYEERLENRIKTAVEKKGKGDLSDLLNSGNTWEVK